MGGSSEYPLNSRASANCSLNSKLHCQPESGADLLTMPRLVPPIQIFPTSRRDLGSIESCEGNSFLVNSVAAMIFESSLSSSLRSVFVEQSTVHEIQVLDTMLPFGSFHCA
jgi:hypothetical protein